MSAARLRRPGDLFDVLDALELAFEAGERVERAGVGVAALFEELFAVCRRACGRCRRSSLAGQRGEEACARVRAGLRVALSMAAVLALLGAQHGLDVAGELVEALRAEADAEVVARRPLRARAPRRR